MVLVIASMGLAKLHAQMVTTQYGPIQGSVNGGIYQFLGIPFAKPPVDDLRWKAPESPESWSTTLNTVDFAPVCPQKNFDQGGQTSTIVGNEDCLYLNVWTPAIGTGSRPVLVFIHGGGNQQGSASEENAGTQMFFGKNMAERGNAVVVTIQYRLGPLGFLVHPGLETENVKGVSGNYAVLDQILALQWVQNNIDAFGGDPNKVMIFGESAGGIDVGNLLTTPLASGLFQRACIESAVPMVGVYNDEKVKGISYVNDFITSGTNEERIAYMRSLTSDELVQNETAPLSGGAVGLQWLAVDDNVVFNNTPTVDFQAGTFNKVPLIIGSNSEEMSLSVPATVYPFMVTALIKSKVPTALQPQAEALYPAGSTNEEAKQSYIAILTDAQFTSPTRRTAQCVSLNQTEPVWRYFFTYKHSIASLAALGSYHGMELFYVFNNWENATLGKGPLFSANDGLVQDAMLQYWVNFANSGNPNGAGLVSWPQYTSASDDYLEIKALPDGSQKGIRTAQSDLWDAVVGFNKCTSSTAVTEHQHEDLFTIYPNPTTGKLTLTPLDENNEWSVEMYDFKGQRVLKRNNAKQMDISTMAQGVYLLVIRQNNEVWQSKIVKR